MKLSSLQRLVFPIPRTSILSVITNTKSRNNYVWSLKLYRKVAFFVIRSSFLTPAYNFHRGISSSRCHITTCCQFWFPTLFGAQDQIFLSVRFLRFCRCGVPSLKKDRYIIAAFIDVTICHLYSLVQFCMSAFYMVICQDFGSFMLHIIYSLIYN
jgi:hypothetical protein